jgi:hypothetical protein
VSRFWLTYRRKYGSRLLGVIIIDSTSIVQARMDAAADGTDEGREFVEGIEMELAHATLVPNTAIGRMLKVDEAEKLLQLIERQTKAPS